MITLEFNLVTKMTATFNNLKDCFSMNEENLHSLYDKNLQDFMHDNFNDLLCDKAISFYENFGVNLKEKFILLTKDYMQSDIYQSMLSEHNLYKAKLLKEQKIYFGMC